MDKIEQATKAFCIVRDVLGKRQDDIGKAAYRKAWKKSMNFFREHSTNEAIKILEIEAKNALNKWHFYDK